MQRVENLISQECPKTLVSRDSERYNGNLGSWLRYKNHEVIHNHLFSIPGMYIIESISKMLIFLLTLPFSQFWWTRSEVITYMSLVQAQVTSLLARYVLLDFSRFQIV